MQHNTVYMFVQICPFRHADNDKASGVMLIRWIIDICSLGICIYVYIYIYTHIYFLNLYMLIYSCDIFEELILEINSRGKKHYSRLTLSNVNYLLINLIDIFIYYFCVSLNCLNRSLTRTY